jgi:hypothetical protein
VAIRAIVHGIPDEFRRAMDASAVMQRPLATESYQDIIKQHFTGNHGSGVVGGSEADRYPSWLMDDP